MNTQRILITGAGGFIGKNLVEQLSDTYTIYAPLHAELELLDADAVLAYLQDNPVDVIIHAANLGGNRNNTHLVDVEKNNIQIFENLIAAKKFFGRMITLGSGAEYDKSKPIVSAVEADADVAHPTDEYGIYKSYISDFAKEVDYITHIRLFAVFGPHEDYRVRFISNNICRVLLDLPIQINQNVNFDFTYIDDVVAVIRWMLHQETPQHTHYNVNSGQKVDLLTLAEQIITVSGKELAVTVVKEGMNKEYTGSNVRLLEEMGEYTFTPIDQSIQTLYTWYKNHLEEIDTKSILFDHE